MRDHAWMPLVALGGTEFASDLEVCRACGQTRAPRATAQPCPGPVGRWKPEAKRPLK